MDHTETAGPLSVPAGATETMSPKRGMRLRPTLTR